MTTEQLKPCPFCSADMSSFVRSAESFCRGEGSALYVPCDCGAMGPEGKTTDDAIAAWNRRTPVELSAQTAEPYGYVLKTGHGTAFRETLAGVEPDFIKHWVRVYTHPAKTEQLSLSDALEVVHKFLLGEGPLDGFYFGDSDTARPRPAFWWRKYLRAAIANGAPK